MTTEQRHILINEIRSLPDLLEESVVGLNDEQLDTPYREGGWTLRQVVHHIADSHLNAYIRMKAILTEEHPTLKPYDQDSWAALSDSQLPLQASLVLIRALMNVGVSFWKTFPRNSGAGPHSIQKMEK